MQLGVQLRNPGLNKLTSYALNVPFPPDLDHANKVLVYIREPTYLVVNFQEYSF